MDIKSIKPTAQVTFELEGKGGSVTFEVAFIALDQVGDYLPKAQAPGQPAAKPAKFSTLVRAMLIDAVQSWDLTENGEPLACDEETKERYLPVIFGLRIKGDQENPFDKVLGRALMNFAGDSENFLKN